MKYQRLKSFDVPLRSPSGIKLAWLVVLLVCLSGNVAVGQQVDFENDIAPIFEYNCVDCHSEDGESGLNLESRANMLVGGDSGLPTIVPGKPEESYLMDVVNHIDEEMAMPPGDDKIPQDEIDLLVAWIQQGAPWPGQMDDVFEQTTDHWSFQPVSNPQVPESEAANPIDAFLLQTLKQQKLSYSAPADPRTMIRRASIVLTGLPPTPEEIADFESASRQNAELAYEMLIDRLLSSPHFGERWAQHWLDVIRWAETNGSESNMYRKNAWVYRDYVVQAFNEDKPYDQFLFEQIAGDSIGCGVATGFLVAGPHVPAATVGQEPSARRQARADRMDEILQTVGASALGLTIGCARCHNHKFDPISIKDYYSMSAVFQDVEFGSRLPELSADDPRQVRGDELWSEIVAARNELIAFGPFEEHWKAWRTIHFQPAVTNEVRISFLWESVIVDELEIFGPSDVSRNLALSDEDTVVESPEEMAIERQELFKINDGEFGTEHWGARGENDSNTKPWVTFKFSSPQEINRIRISSNREDYYETDFLEKMNEGHITPYRIEVREEDGSWRQVAATPRYQRLDENNEARAEGMTRLQDLVDQLVLDGPQPTFVGRFVPPATTYVFGRGSPENPRNEVFAAAPDLLAGDLNIDDDANGLERRIAFANWLSSPANPLTARVAVNRIWHHIFGRGIVATTSDFGAAGAPPTHPELLDWLATEFATPSRSDGTAWSSKEMIRMIVMSKAFRQASLPRQDGISVDADSALLWRFPPRRFEAEVIRDSILVASGSLNPVVGGESFRIHNVKKRYSQWEVVDNHGPETWRRMLYQERMRRVDDQMFTAFDFPDCGQVRARRPISTTPLQALNLMNSRFVLEQAELIAARANAEADGDIGEAIKRCFELLLGRAPDAQELQACLDVTAEEDLSLVCRALINSNEFVFLP
ncbi:MAG: PSD1 and planctomycete cytochrome C domain-containing protein [Planctomycetota bacterium]